MRSSTSGVVRVTLGGTAEARELHARERDWVCAALRAGQGRALQLVELLGENAGSRSTSASSSSAAPGSPAHLLDEACACARLRRSAARCAFRRRTSSLSSGAAALLRAAHEHRAGEVARRLAIAMRLFSSPQCSVSVATTRAPRVCLGRNAARIPLESSRLRVRFRCFAVRDRRPRRAARRTARVAGEHGLQIRCRWDLRTLGALGGDELAEHPIGGVSGTARRRAAHPRASPCAGGRGTGRKAASLRSAMNSVSERMSGARCPSCTFSNSLRSVVRARSSSSAVTFSRATPSTTSSSRSRASASCSLPR